MQLTGLDHSELLAENLAPDASTVPADVRHGLSHLAMARSERIHLTTELFESLRKLSGQEIARKYLGAIQVLASDGTPAGARLLAAFLNVASPGERLLPRLRELDSSRRYATGLADAPGGLGASQGDWLARLQKLQIAAKLWVAETELLVPPARPDHPRHREPWPLLRTVFADLLERTTGDGFDRSARGPQLLLDLMRLETDAWQERTSQLAGSVHPFKVETVARVLPMLNRIDGQIRDVRQMIGAAAEGDLEGAFLRPQARWREVLDDKDWVHLQRDLGADPGLAALARLAEGLAQRPIPIPQLAAGISRIRRLSAEMAAGGLRAGELDLLTACVLVQTHYANGQLAFTLSDELAGDIQDVLDAAAASGEPLPGMEIIAGLLMIDLTGAEETPAHGLPHVREFNEAEDLALKHWRQANAEVDPTDLEAMREEALALARRLEGDDDEEEEVIDMDTAALKHLVLTNIQSVSVLLGFLRNPKVYAIPGLVEDVVNRTRNPQIIETIANDRALHRGFANKGVPLACLRSPINVSVKVLRKFCHVKYVSKIDLKRLSADRTGIRKEVAREIEKYLEALA